MVLSWTLLVAVGLLAGWLAERVTKSSLGPGVNLVLGLVGALVGRVFSAVLGLATTTVAGAILAATLGAAVLLLVANAGCPRRPA